MVSSDFLGHFLPGLFTLTFIRFALLTLTLMRFALVFLTLNKFAHFCSVQFENKNGDRHLSPFFGERDQFVVITLIAISSFFSFEGLNQKSFDLALVTWLFNDAA